MYEQLLHLILHAFIYIQILHWTSPTELRKILASE